MMPDARSVCILLSAPISHVVFMGTTLSDPSIYRITIRDSLRVKKGKKGCYLR